MLVGVDYVVPDKKADREEHGCVEILPLCIRPPSASTFSEYVYNPSPSKKARTHNDANRAKSLFLNFLQRLGSGTALWFSIKISSTSP